LQQVNDSLPFRIQRSLALQACTHNAQAAPFVSRDARKYKKNLRKFERRKKMDELCMYLRARIRSFYKESFQNQNP